MELWIDVKILELKKMQIHTYLLLLICPEYWQDEKEAKT